MSAVIESRIVSEQTRALREELVNLLEEHGEFVPNVQVGNRRVKELLEKGVYALTKLPKSALKFLPTERIFKRRIAVQLAEDNPSVVMIEPSDSQLDFAEIRFGLRGEPFCLSLPPQGAAKLVESGTNKVTGNWQEISTPATVNHLQIYKTAYLGPVRQQLVPVNG